MDSSIDLQQPVINGGIRSINFFNGRMLTARDLTREQTANREATWRLGQAVGEGIAYGLELSKSSASTNEAPVISVSSGLAVNRQGQTLWLRDKTDVALVRKASASTPGLIFSECRPLQAGTYVAGAGVYLLTMAPAETREGRAATSALNTGGAPCNTDAVVSAVQFRLIQLDPPLTAAELQDEDHLQNLIAYKCFGVSETQLFVKDPFGSELTAYGLLESLRPSLLTDCDVPLGILYWTLAGGIKFIDMWSVRRRVIDPATTDSWKLLVGERHLAEVEAMLLQFEDQLAQLRFSSGDPRLTIASSHCKYLPPVGLIPIYSTASPKGFRYEKFFQNVTYCEPLFIEGAKVELLFRSALSCKPIDLTSGEMIWLYKIRENAQAIDSGAGVTPQPYMIFSSGYVPFLAGAQFDLSRWEYSNYSNSYCLT
jgi:hypothetical protein